MDAALLFRLIPTAEQLSQLDTVKINFAVGGSTIINIAIGIIMFGVALGIKAEHFKNVFAKPKSIIVGLVSQYVMLPAVTFLLILLMKPSPAVAMGMILVASCPGGNISNFMSSLAKANVALSVSLTAISTVICLIMTPVNYTFWGHLYASTNSLNVELSINPIDMFKTVVIILGIPITIGMFVNHKFPVFTEKIKVPIKYASIFVFVGVVIGAFYSNYDHFIKYIGLIFVIVLIHNASALFIGYLFPKVMRLTQVDCRTISIETGIQNSGLGLALLFNPKIFDPSLQLGGLTFITAWWGIWHIISGFVIAYHWNRRALRVVQKQNSSTT